MVMVVVSPADVHLLLDAADVVAAGGAENGEQRAVFEGDREDPLLVAARFCARQAW